MNDTVITVVGNAVADPELRFTPSSVAVCNLRIASTPRRFDKQRNEWVDDPALFLAVTCWKQHAENVAESVKRGDRLIVQGKLVQRQFEKKDGTRGSSYEIADAEIAVSLLRATATVQKAGTTNGQQQSSGGYGAQQNGGYGQQQPPADPWANGGTAAGQWGAPVNEPPF